MDKEKMKEASKNGVKNLGSKSRGFFGEFKEFALKGNVMDLAVGVIIGGAFQAIVNSVVNDLINPLISCLIKTDFSNLYLPLSEAAKKAFDANKPLAAVKDEGLAVFAYGNFITAVINFFIMALIIFFIVKLINKAKDIGSKKQEVIEEATTKKCPYCCSEIDINAVVCPHCTSKLEK